MGSLAAPDSWRPAVAALLWLFCCLAGRDVSAAERPLYDDALAAGLANWSWDAGVDFNATSPVQAGSRSLAVTFLAAWAGLYLHADAGLPVGANERLRFFVNGGPTGGQVLRVSSNSGGATTVRPQANVWTEVVIALSELGSPSVLTDLYWQDATGAASPTFHLDAIVLETPSGPPPPPESGPELSIDAAASRRPISPDIHGMNFADEALAAELQLPVRRHGGNAASRYNWRLDVHNTGQDWYFENITRDTPDPAALPHGSATDAFVEQNRRTGTKSLLTAPMIGATPKRRVSGHPFDCGFKVSKYGAQQSTDPWDADCGNGLWPAGGNVSGNDPTDTSEAADPSFVRQWIEHLTGKYGMAASGGVAFFNLDNEPMLWNSTHRDIHPAPVTYDEIIDRTLRYAVAIKDADPGAKILGPVVWGWCAYLYSAADGCSPGADYQAHGNTPFLPWYLDRMREYEEEHGRRILDYLDAHYYPQASGVALSTAGDASVQALRLRSVKSLWDPAYTDESWIGQPVRLIPRLRQWVAEHYPGTRLALTEYNFGGLESINGALAQADALGVFGREGLDLATLWAPPGTNEPGAFAFRMYRNYDGAGHGFGDTAVSASSGDQDRLSVYAATREGDAALTVMVVNKTGQALTSRVRLSGFAAKPQAEAYRYGASDTGAIARLDDQAVGAGGFEATFPETSITLFVLKKAAVATGGVPLLLLRDD